MVLRRNLADVRLGHPRNIAAGDDEDTSRPNPVVLMRDDGAGGAGGGATDAAEVPPTDAESVRWSAAGSTDLIFFGIPSCDRGALGFSLVSRLRYKVAGQSTNV